MSTREELMDLWRAARAAERKLWALCPNQREQVGPCAYVSWQVSLFEEPGGQQLTPRVQMALLRGPMAPDAAAVPDRLSPMEVSPEALTRIVEVRAALAAWERNEAEWPLARL